MNRVFRLARTALVFLGSTALVFLGIRFLLTGVGGGSWLISTSLVFLGAGVMTWVARRAFLSCDPQKRFIGVGAIAMNALVASFAWSIGVDADTETRKTAAWMILGIVSVNVGGLLAAILERGEETRSER